ncbi:LysM peptidoglycan-binding domain-containing protein [Hymenobacter sp. BT188]|uniref:LysM peptidoglycan-binding domain-containing protein n=1 Tax=Hymenobacter sp. BT188 TaxID=2763504 RepID=UPI0016516861|nr:LysM peptidoglycan-binding domain-containing protein [Hymenobacter sp. BT188]MBC6606188.1 LysM peptidoglycan-binding domain-containing protein [Hymenobacter sp. BT188]
MKKSLLRTTVLFLLTLAVARPAAAQKLANPKPDVQRTNDDTTRVSIELLPDTLVLIEPILPDTARLRWLQKPPAVRDLVADRIACLETDVPHTFNNSVMSFVDYFTVRNRTYTQRILERQNLYFPLFEKYLAKYNLPQDLKYLAVVESALLPQAKSRVGALGLWQFMGPTASDLRLTRNEYVDERMDPEKSTEAACKYLRDLYRMFGDWELVLAAYNYGSGNIRRAIAKSGGKRDFWAIYPYLPKETRNYVPTFTATFYTLQYAREHRLHSDSLRYQYPEPMDTLLISGRSLDLRKFSAQFGLDSAAVSRYNPELRKPYIPETLRNYSLKVPVRVRQELAAQDRNLFLDFCKVSVPPPSPLTPRLLDFQGFGFSSTAVAATNKPALAEPRHRKVRHTVKRGETVRAIAARYDVTTAQLARWNSLQRGKALVPKQQLIVLVPITEKAAPSKNKVAANRLMLPEKLPLIGVKTPPTVAKATITKPAQVPVAEAAEEAQATIAAVEQSITVSSSKPVALKAAATTDKVDPGIVASGTTFDAATEVAQDSLPTEYIVRKGDFLEKLARTKGVSVAQLMAWNQLKSVGLSPGQKLVFYVPADAETLAQNAPQPTEEKAPRVALTKPSTTKASPSRAAIKKVHLVQPGDTLYNISRRYEGVTVDQLRKLNNLKSDAVKPGQQLIVAR